MIKALKRRAWYDRSRYDIHADDQQEFSQIMPPGRKDHRTRRSGDLRLFGDHCEAYSTQVVLTRTGPSWSAFNKGSRLGLARRSGALRRHRLFQNHRAFSQLIENGVLTRELSFGSTLAIRN